MSQVKVKKYKGEHALRRGIESMSKQGWVVQSQSSRKKVFSLLSGFFTRKQIHTVTYVRLEHDAGDQVVRAASGG